MPINQSSAVLLLTSFNDSDERRQQLQHVALLFRKYKKQERISQTSSPPPSEPNHSTYITWSFFSVIKINKRGFHENKNYPHLSFHCGFQSTWLSYGAAERHPCILPELEKNIWAGGNGPAECRAIKEIGQDEQIWEVSISMCVFVGGRLTRLESLMEK